MPTYFKAGTNNSNFIYSDNESVILYAIWGKKGDVTLSGDVGLIDVIEILKHLSSGTLSGVRLVAADVNGDGTVCLLDALEILKHLAGMTSVIDN